MLKRCYVFINEVLENGLHFKKYQFCGSQNDRYKKIYIYKIKGIVPHNHIWLIVLFKKNVFLSEMLSIVTAMKGREIQFVFPCSLLSKTRVSKRKLFMFNTQCIE